MNTNQPAVGRIVCERSIGQKNQTGFRIYHAEYVDSTNEVLKRNAQEFGHGAALYTLDQRAGKGRRGRIWQATAGDGLALSVLLSPKALKLDGSDEQRRDRGWLAVMPLVMGLAVCDALKSMTGLTPAIKWPNDILCGERKICGILCESIVQQSRILYIGGVGINLRQSRKTLLEQALPHATSVKAETAMDLAPALVAEVLCDALWDRLNGLMAHGFDESLRGEYAAQCITLGCTVRVESANGPYEAQAVGVDTDGALIVRRAGTDNRVIAGEVSVRGLHGYAQ